MSLENPEKLSITSACFISCLKHKIMWNGYRELSQFLGGYKYILPADRFVSEKLTILLFNHLIEIHEPRQAVFLLDCYTRIIESCITTEQQHELIYYYEHL